MKPSSLVAVTLCLVLTASICPAWELSLRGECEWRFRYIARTGPSDLFGNANVAQAAPNNGTAIGLTGPQALALRLEGYSSKGSDAAYFEQRFWWFPEFRLNQAISVRAVITAQGNLNANYIGGGANWATNPQYSGWIMMDSRDLFGGTGLAVPVFRSWWARVQTPLGILMLGVRPAGFGMGWALHTDDSQARSVALFVPYGPFLFGLSQHLHSPKYTDPNDNRNNRNNYFSINSAVDQNPNLPGNSVASISYSHGSTEMGGMLNYIRANGHHGKADLTGSYQGDIGTAMAAAMAGGAAYGNPDLPIYLGAYNIYLGIFYLKYEDGLFFVNGEFDFLFQEAHRNGGRPLYGNAHGWAAEAGLYRGPAKLTLAHFYRSGHDRRGGQLYLSGPTGYNPTSGTFTYDRNDRYFNTYLGAGDAPINPYNFLLGLYGTGNNGYNTTGKCNYEDLLAWAVRLDYSVAANLNVFVSAMKAQRASNTATPQGFFTGTWFGALGPGTGTLIDGPISPTYPTYPVSNGSFPYTTKKTPNVPDDDLGVEFNVGCQWKLLEAVTFELLFAHWQPGRWFKFAYRDMTVSDPPKARFGVVNPGRDISPLMAWQSSLLIEF
jgi:hypothetical protein